MGSTFSFFKKKVFRYCQTHAEAHCPGNVLNPLQIFIQDPLAEAEWRAVESREYCPSLQKGQERFERESLTTGHSLSPKSAWYQEEVCPPCSGNDADLNLAFRDLVADNGEGAR